MSTAEARALPDQEARLASYPWMLIGLLWLVAFLNAADRSILIAVMPQLREEFGLTPTQLALISSAFFWIYAVCAFLFGRLGDGTRRSRVIIYGLAFWSVATGMASLATGFAMLIALRGFVAVGEASYYPAGTAMISDWHRPAMRSRALSIHQTGVFAGAGFGAFLAGMIADRFGWRMPFVIFGVVGLIYCIILYQSLRDAPPRITPAAVGAQTPSTQSPLQIVLSRPPALFLCVVFCLGTGASTGVTVWAPTFVHDALGLDLANSALYGSATINIAGFLSVPLGGLLADWLAARTPIGRFYTLAIGLTLAALLLLPLLLAKSALEVGLVLLASSIGKGLFDGCIYASMHDVVPREARATAVGLMTMLGFVGAGVTPIAVAQIGEKFGMAAGMTSVTVLYFLAVALLLVTRSSTRRTVLQTREAEALMVTGH